jgi:hypothetical protein
MSRYRKVDPRIWNDAKFRALSDNGKLAFFMLLTHPNMTALGGMRTTVAGLAEELGWSTEAFREAFQEALRKGMAKHDEKACLVVLPNFLRYNKPESPNVIKAWANSLDLLPECPLKSELIERVKAFAEGMTKTFGEALPEAFAKAMPYQEQEQEQEKDSPSEEGNGRDKKRKVPVDERHAPFREALAHHWSKCNRNGIEMTWGPAEGKALKLFLSANPSIDLPRFEELLHHRARSEAINTSDRPSLWLGSLTSFASGPLDRFRKPLQAFQAKRIYANLPKGVTLEEAMQR